MLGQKQKPWFLPYLRRHASTTGGRGRGGANVAYTHTPPSPPLPSVTRAAVHGSDLFKGVKGGTGAFLLLSRLFHCSLACRGAYRRALALLHYEGRPGYRGFYLAFLSSTLSLVFLLALGILAAWSFFLWRRLWFFP